LRPRVGDLPDNIATDLLEHLNGQLPRFQAMPGLVGITLNGGLSRGYADSLSEVDVTLYLDDAGQVAVESGQCPVPLGIAVMTGQLYDIKTVSYQEELERKFGQVDLWDMSYARILFDPEGKIGELFAAKLSTRPKGEDAADHLWDAYWHYKLAGDIWIARGDVEQGHLVLNRSIEPLLKALFATNEEYVPHEKWLVHMSRTLPWLPGDYTGRLRDAMVPAASDLQGLRQRQQVISLLGEEIDQHIRQQHLSGFALASHQKYFYDLLKWLAERGSVPLGEWCDRARLSFLCMDPFRLVASIEHDSIVLDTHRLRALTTGDMYAWHYEIAAAVATELPF
jgi:hypothetical protein